MATHKYQIVIHGTTKETSEKDVAHEISVRMKISKEEIKVKRIELKNGFWYHIITADCDIAQIILKRKDCLPRRWHLDNYTSHYNDPKLVISLAYAESAENDNLKNFLTAITQDGKPYKVENSDSTQKNQNLSSLLLKVNYEVQLIVDKEVDCNYYVSSDQVPKRVIKVDIRGNNDYLVILGLDTVGKICDAVNTYWRDYW